MIYKKIEIKVDGYKETADLYTYFLDNSIEMHINRKRPVVVICPGGGYSMTSDREAEPIAMQYLAKGYHTVTDDCVSVENSLLFFNALRKFKIPVEMHLYPVGGHGLSLANEETSYEDGRCIQKECQTWMELACKWIENIK